MSTSVIARVAAKKVIQPPIAAGILTTVDKVLANIKHAAKKFDRKPPRLVAVSKTQPLEKVQWAYQQGLRHFGENYIQELHEKATQVQLCGCPCSDIKWHYIGHIQRNKLNKLLDCPRLWMVETVHKIMAAKALNGGWGLRNVANADSDAHGNLKVLIEVNTSRKQDKLGCLPEEVCDLASYIVEECKYLDLCGLMTTGSIVNSTVLSTDCPSSLDFATLLQCRDVLMSSHLPQQHSQELSMGISADYQQAIEMGSTSVRLGTAVFGPRATPSAMGSSHHPT